MPRVYLGDALEAAAARLGLERRALIDFVWNCPCRNRQRRYVELAGWAEALARGDFDEAEARRRLAEMLARRPKG